MNHLARCVAVLLPALLIQPLSAAEEYNAVYGNGAKAFTVATGSPGELGLLEALAKSFNKRHDTAIRWKKAGSGASLALLREKKVDVVLIHAPEREQRAVAEGWAVNRTLIGSNEFYIVGPSDDPARISEAASAAEAYRRIAQAEALFLSRGDNSGTHQKEMAVWRRAKIAPSGAWYVATKDFMLATLRKANQESAYFMTDSSTWIAARAGLSNLRLLFRGDPTLVNVYHALVQPPEATPGEPYGAKFVDFLRSPEAQTIIRDFGRKRYGDALYRNAGHACSGKTQIHP
ncbi:MAG: substrate-binding domain-containing protein [Planctomycetes bacterium]|nr:substrate-binding domain-containing protein [Planctomycetota bacterium]